VSRTVALRRRLRTRTAQRGQAIVEFAMVVPLFMLLLLVILDFGFAFDHALTLQYATREGSRVGAALANGGGLLGCGGGQSPNRAEVDPSIVAAVDRVLRSPGSRVNESLVPTIRIYKANAAGTEIGPVDVWTYSSGATVTIDGAPVVVNYALSSTGWAPCSRDNSVPDSIGVSLSYTYHFVTPLGSVAKFFGGSGAGAIPITDHTVMALNPTAQ
jgi:hypothetical protein